MDASQNPAKYANEQPELDSISQLLLERILHFFDPRLRIANPNSDYSLIWLACLYSIVPALFKFVAVPMLWRYPLTEDKLREVQADIEAGNQPA